MVNICVLKGILAFLTKNLLIYRTQQKAVTKPKACSINIDAHDVIIQSNII